MKQMSKLGMLILLCMIPSLAWFGPVQAEPKKWGQVGGWTIYMAPESKSCWAWTIYDDNVQLTVAFDFKGTPSLFIGGLRDITPGKKYEIRMLAGDGNAGRLRGEGLPSTKAIVFDGLHYDTLKSLVQSDNIYLDGLGKYNLKDSKAALAEAWACWEIVKDTL